MEGEDPGVAFVLCIFVTLCKHVPSDNWRVGIWIDLERMCGTPPPCFGKGGPLQKEGGS
jgi:hypothetical protein